MNTYEKQGEGGQLLLTRNSKNARFEYLNWAHARDSRIQGTQITDDESHIAGGALSGVN
jgi:hypothetical protein